MMAAHANVKQAAYDALVLRRKACTACTPHLTNPARHQAGRYDSDQIGPWTLWQGNLSADVLVVGEDWGGVDTLEDYEGRDPADLGKFQTNKSLVALLAHLGVPIGAPQTGGPNVAFFTNAVLCLKPGNATANRVGNPACFATCGRNFLKPTITIVAPKLVVTLGKRALGAVLSAFGKGEAFWKAAAATPVPAPYKVGQKPTLFERAVTMPEPFWLEPGIALGAVYHCGSKANMNRKGRQEGDWARMRPWLIQKRETPREPRQSPTGFAPEGAMETTERTPQGGGVADAASIASPVAQKPASGVRPLTMVEAKQGLAAMYGVDVAQIEITIRG